MKNNCIFKETRKEGKKEERKEGNPLFCSRWILSPSKMLQASVVLFNAPQ
jgi:hypothetical protein